MLVLEAWWLFMRTVYLADELARHSGGTPQDAMAAMYQVLQTKIGERGL